MELSSIDKYIHMTKLAQGVEVMFAGQPCLKITEGLDSYNWTIYPLFAKLTYGANIFEDVPYCFEYFDTLEQAIADGLSTLHEMGAFRGEVDLPDDTYAKSEVNESVLNSILKDCRAYACKHSNSLLEAHDLSVGLFESIIAEANTVDETALNEGMIAALAGKFMGAEPKIPKYKVGQTVSYQSSEPQPDWKDGGIGKGKITKYSNGHYTVNGNPINHFEIKKLHENSETKSAFSWKSVDNPVAATKNPRGKPTFGATVEEMKVRMRENIIAGKRPHTGFDRNEKLRILRSGAMEHPEFSGTHIKSAGRPHGTTKAAADEKKKAAASVFSMWSGLGKKAPK